MSLHQRNITKSNTNIDDQSAIERLALNYFDRIVIKNATSSKSFSSSDNIGTFYTILMDQNVGNIQTNNLLVVNPKG